MDNDKKDDLFNDDDMNLLPLDFPEDDEEEEEIKEEKSVTSEVSEDSDIESEVDDVVMETEEPPEDNEVSEVEEKIPTEEINKEDTDREEKIEEKKEEKLPPPAKKAEEVPKPIQFSSNFLPGQILQEGRVRCDLSIEQVAQETKIKKGFVMALEQGDKENLPPKVYVAAYVKQLCRLYKIDSSQVLNSMSGEINNDKKVSGEILQDIEKGKQVNFQEEVRVRKFFKIVAIVIFVLAVTITLVVKFALPDDAKPSQGGSSEGPTLVEEGTEGVKPEQTITSEDLEIFLVKQPFTMTEMEVPQ